MDQDLSRAHYGQLFPAPQWFRPQLGYLEQLEKIGTMRLGPYACGLRSSLHHISRGLNVQDGFFTHVCHLAWDDWFYAIFHVTHMGFLTAFSIKFLRWKLASPRVRILWGKKWKLPIFQGLGPHIGKVSLSPYSINQTVTVTIKIQGQES